MSGDAPVDPAEVPVFTGNLATLDAKVKEISSGGAAVSTKASDVHSSFGGLQAFYQAPEADQLFATTKPVSDLGLKLSSDMCTIAGALGTYSRDAAPVVKKLENLKAEAEAFRTKVSKEDKWREDGDLIDENLERRNKIAEVWAEFQEVERAAHAKIVALVGGKPLRVNDGSNAKDMYGYDAEAMKQSKSLPWGDAVEESIPAWQVWEHAWEFGKGVVVDGVWGTLKGLGGLVGLQGWDVFKQSWTGLAKLGTGLAILSIPGAGPLFLSAPDDKLPSWLRDSRTAMKETGKALLAWDQWGSNPSRAAGAVTFNVVTTIFTGGAGGAAAGAGKAGAVAKTLSFAGKAGHAIDPMTYIFKGAGAGFSKIGDVMAGLKGAGKFEVPSINLDGAVALPDGAVMLPDGAIHLPSGAVIPEGAAKLPDGNIRLPEGTTTFPPGTVKLPVDGPAQFMDPKGNIYEADGSLSQAGKDSPKEPAAETGAGVPRTEAPKVDTPATARVPELELAGVGGRGGDNGINLGSHIDGPLHTLDNGPRGVDNTPGGLAPDNMPRGDLNNPGGGRPDTPSTPATHADTPSTAATHGDGPSTGATHGDGPGGPGGTHNPLGGHGPGYDGIPALGDDAARGADDGTTPAGSHDGQPTPPAAGQQLTPEQVKAKQDEFVQKANDDKAWFSQYYRVDGHRHSVQTKIDGVELPILAKDSDGSWISKNSLPSAGSETKFGKDPFLRDEAHPQIDHLDDVARDRKVSVDLANAERAHKNGPTADTLDELARAQARFDTRMTPRWGENTSNNTSFSERLGEDAARLHVVPERFPGSVEQPLPKTPNGANMFDQLYRRPDGKLMIIEAKAPSSSLLWRKGVGPAEGFMVKQGTEPYLRTIIAEMELRPNLKVTDPSGKVWKNSDLADELTKALDSGNLEYAMVKAKDGGTQYAGAVLEFFKI
ncbi:hypothetical protein NRK68_18550 [Streptomyces yangpuensis]|uniref:WXG100 family type VII secretion target n=1 Tax=Streptomyces yangpuensis TaxID=1648182 RepID=A0ABY5PXZ1_9ACTN|nr:hypothetical protein [Streptomyces yangpuensis]UUY49026.1 hypothetical protein NRK68_18550 [Streptomyces yangpuensis]